jgi:glyoxylase-like metal-dependent hydrolase (beta-lactamase superfamily II)
MSLTALPPPSPNQAYCSVSVLEAGHLLLPCSWTISNAAPGETLFVPSLSFLLQHSATGEKFVLDLGIRKDAETALPPAAREFMKIFPVTVKQDVVESLSKGGLKPDEIDHVCLTHLHFDHIGDTAPFTKAQFVVGGETRKILRPGYPGNPNSMFSSDLLPEGRTLFLSPTGNGPDAHKWTSLGPFPQAYDYFGDGSLYVIDAAGHLPGHSNILARTSSDGGWIYLAGDSAHDWRLVRGQSDIAAHQDEHGHVTMCMHLDIPKARLTIERISKLLDYPRVRVIIAHDVDFWEANQDRAAFWPGKLPSL